MEREGEGEGEEGEEDELMALLYFFLIQVIWVT